MQTNDYSVMQQFGTSAFNKVLQWHKLGEVENEYTSEKLVLFAIFVPKIFTIGWNLTKFWQKISLRSFFETRCYSYECFALFKKSDIHTAVKETVLWWCKKS